MFGVAHVSFIVRQQVGNLAESHTQAWNLFLL